MAISFKELLDGNVINDLPVAHQHNLVDLQEKINKVRTKRGIPMIVTSGYRSLQDHIRIYSELAAKRKQLFDPKKVPMGSCHLIGRAVDISDLDGSLMQWCQDNIKFLEEVGLWMEEPDDQKRVHFQTKPPLSGRRFFKP